MNKLSQLNFNFMVWKGRNIRQSCEKILKRNVGIRNARNEKRIKFCFDAFFNHIEGVSILTKIFTYFFRIEWYFLQFSMTIIESLFIDKIITHFASLLVNFIFRSLIMTWCYIFYAQSNDIFENFISLLFRPY